jgi:hypothetical protein
VWRRENFLDLHTLHAVAELLAIDLVTVAQEVGRRGVVRERVYDLLGGPEGGGVLGDVEVDDAAAMVGEHDEDEQHAQARRRHGEEIDGDQIADMVSEEGPPGLRRVGTPCRHEARHGALGHIDTQLKELAMDARGAPQWVGGGDSGDQGPDLGIGGGRATSGCAGRELGPVLAEAAPLPPQDGIRAHDDEGRPPPGPDSGQADPEEAVRSA